MMRMVAIAAAALLPLQPVAAQQASDAPLAPAGRWDVDYGASLCTLTRDFNGPHGLVSLGLVPLTGGDQLKVLAVGIPGSAITGHGRATISASATEPMIRDYYSSVDAKSHRPIVLIRAKRGDLEQIGSASVLTVETKGHMVRLQVPGIAAALKALEACEVDLAKSWGYDPTLVSNPAKALNPGSWLTNGDYPAAAIRQNEAGETDFRMTVGADGKVTGCTVILGSGSPPLDAQTCAAMSKRARFTPATGLDGKPVPGIYSNAVMWMIPGY